MNAWLKIDGIVGTCGARKVFLGFAPARILHSLSFADILDEETGLGYQRPRNVQHSLDFRKYISQPASSTIPLTFNLRTELRANWKIKESDEKAVLLLKRGTRSLAQVDCQHRLGELGASDVPLAFMSFIGMDLREEMAMFVTINKKAKGLSSSLTDFHQSNLLEDLVKQAPHLYIAKKLNEDPGSPWFRMIKIGGRVTSGLKRRTSLRMMQKAVRKFLNRTKEIQELDPDMAYDVIVNYWKAVAKVFPTEWQDPRHHLLTKGIGLYSLMSLLGDLVLTGRGKNLTENFFVGRLRSLGKAVEWRSSGMFAGVGGQRGAAAVYHKLQGVLHASSVS
jgi:DNA sulfur modification protein DndB